MEKTIEQLKKDKALIEASMLNSVRQFEEFFGVSVIGIYITARTQIGKQNSAADIKLDVQL